MIDYVFYTFVIIAAVNFIIAIAYRLVYEKSISNKNVSSYQLERLSALEQSYTLIGIVLSVLAIIVFI